MSMKIRYGVSWIECGLSVDRMHCQCGRNAMSVLIECGGIRYGFSVDSMRCQCG